MRQRRSCQAMAASLLCLGVGLIGCDGTRVAGTDSPASSMQPLASTSTFPSAPSTNIEASTTSATVALTTTTTVVETTTAVSTTAVATCRVSVPDPDERGFFTIGFTSNQPEAAVALKAISSRTFRATTNSSGAASIRFSLGAPQPGRTINFVATVGAAHCSTAYTQ